MDLFDDLPEPGKEKADAVPLSTAQEWSDSSTDFFSDLPLPSATSSEARGVKRKLDEHVNNDSCGNEEINNEYKRYRTLKHIFVRS